MVQCFSEKCCAMELELKPFPYCQRFEDFFYRQEAKPIIT